MKRSIVVAIEPHEDGVRCGECPRRNTPASIEFYCNAWRWDGIQAIRGPLCLAAERKLAALIEAGEELYHSFGTADFNIATKDWDRAVAEVKK